MSDAVERDTECARLRGSAATQGEINSDFDGAGTGTSKNRNTDTVSIKQQTPPKKCSHYMINNAVQYAE
jgi:hypothetical protein